MRSPLATRRGSSRLPRACRRAERIVPGRRRSRNAPAAAGSSSAADEDARGQLASPSARRARALTDTHGRIVQVPACMDASRYGAGRTGEGNHGCFLGRPFEADAFEAPSVSSRRGVACAAAPAQNAAHDRAGGEGAQRARRRAELPPRRVAAPLTLTGRSSSTASERWTCRLNSSASREHRQGRREGGLTHARAATSELPRAVLGEHR